VVAIEFHPLNLLEMLNRITSVEHLTVSHHIADAMLVEVVCPEYSYPT
jgi:hypothetical protein